MARRRLAEPAGRLHGPARRSARAYSQATFRVREFLAKNHVPFIWFDLEADPQVKQLLKQFEVSRSRHPRGRLGPQVAAVQPLQSPTGGCSGPVPAGGAGRCTTWSWSGPAPRGWRRRSTVPRRDYAPWFWTASRPAARPAAACASKTTWAFPQASPVCNWLNEPSRRPKVRSAPARRHSSSSVQFKNAFTVLQLDGGKMVTTQCMLIATGAEYRS